MLKTETFAKIFFLVSCTGLLMYVVLAFYTFHTAYTAISQVQKFRDRIQNLPSTDISYAEERFRNDLKYILFWVIPNKTMSFIEDGQGIFINYNCSFINCYATSNKYLLNGDYRNFEAIVFNASHINTWEDENLPKRRIPRQKYVFYSAESPDANPTCNFCGDNYFNWTWTYKLSSDIHRPFIEVLDKNNVVVAPKENVKWITSIPTSNIGNERSVNRIMKREKYVKHVKKVFAWIVNGNCESKNNRTQFATNLQKALKEKLMIFDIYGCSFLKCPEGGCINELRNKYYFYLVYEDSFAEDYVTAEVINAYNIGAVPVLIGEADFHKFLPDGSYINARNVTINHLTSKIEYIIDNPSVYNSYHRWRKHYTVRKTKEFEGICELCKNLNDEIKFNTKSAHQNFRSWWYSGSLNEKCKLESDPSVAPEGVLKETDIDSYKKILYRTYRNK